MARKPPERSPVGDSPTAGTTGMSGDPARAARDQGFVSQADREAAEEFVQSRYVALLPVSIRRPDDMCIAEASFYNMRAASGTPRTLVRADPALDATLVIELPPQSFGEQALLDLDDPEETAPALGSVRMRMARPSRLAFTMPANVTSIPYTIEGILQACRSWPARRALAAVAEPTMMMPPGANGGWVSTLNEFAASDDFRNARTSYASAIDALAGAAATAAVIAAGKRLATQAVTPTSATDPTRTRAMLDDATRAAIDSIVTQHATLNTKAGRAAVTMAIAHSTVGALAEAGAEWQTSRPELEFRPDLSSMMQVIIPSRPNSKVTAIELPYRLVVSPIGAARWTHRTTAAARQGRNELWHTRLTTAPGNTGTDTPGKLRAIWSEDYLLQSFAITLDLPFRASLDAQDRKMLVQVTSGFNEQTEQESVDYLPRAARADRLILSSLGGLLDADGAWTTRPKGVDLEAWKHLATMGRDHYVRVVYAGYLLPFGHAASLVKVTERKFESTDAGNTLTKRIAALRQRYFLVVRETLKHFDGTYHRTGGHPFPFTSVEILTRVTPNLRPPDDPLCAVVEVGGPLYDKSGVTNGLTPRQLFWPKVIGASPLDFKFDLAAVDRDGHRTSFSLPLLFVSDKANIGVVTKAGITTRLIDNLIAAYNAEGPARRSAQIGGESVCYAPRASDGDVSGDPRMPTESIKFNVSRALTDSTARLNSYPEAESARVALRAVQRILGKSEAMVTVAYADLYKAQGFGAENRGELFLKVISPGINVSFGPGASASRSDVVGAVASPSMLIRGVSRRIGLAADIEKVVNDDFDPNTFFGDAKILGSIRLASVIARASLRDAPRFTTDERPASGSLPARTEARYDWTSTVDHSDATGLLMPNADRQRGSPIRMQSVTSTPIDSPSAATASVTATIGNFKVNLFSFIVLWFRELQFTTERGQKPDVKVDLHPTRSVEFGGPLTFVNRLKELLPGDGFSDPSALTTTPSGIAAHYALTVPSVQVGVFAISGLSIGARFSLPFDTTPAEVGFDFGVRENPFSLTVSLLGGGGFLSIGVGADGVREIEAAVEAQARLAIDLGVASGSVDVALGIYFHWLGDEGGVGGGVQLAGYVRLHGELDVMSVISVSITFYLQLSFEKPEGKGPVIAGEASVTVEIDVLLFSGEVTVRCRREFKGTPGDPTFKDLIPGDSTWSTYCSAFAAE